MIGGICIGTLCLAWALLGILVGWKTWKDYNDDEYCKDYNSYEYWKEYMTMNIEQQQEYVEILRKMYAKVLRTCGEGSRQEKSFLEILVKETEILDEMRSQ
jgi:hypothetical protein